MRRCIPALLVLFVLPLCLLAEKPAAKKPTGTFERESDGWTVTFAFPKAETMKITLVDGSGNKIVVDSAYGVADTNLLFGVITGVEKGGDGPDKGDLFSFRYEIKEGELTISDLDGTRINEDARKRVEGVYKAKK